MSVERERAAEVRLDGTDDPDEPKRPFALSPDVRALCEWLHDSNYVATSRRVGKRRRRERYKSTGYAADTDTRRVHEFHDISPEYEPASRASCRSQQDVTRRWVAMEYPVTNVDSDGVATLYSSDNFRARQHPDGRGVLLHYGETEAWRTRSGLVFNNNDCWSRGFAHCSPPRGDDNDYSMSRGTLRNVFREVDVPGHVDEFDIMDVTEEREEFETDHGFMRTRSVVRLLHLSTGHGVVFFNDDTARPGRGAERIVFALSPDEKQSLREPSDALDFLKPDEVLAAEANGYDIVDAAETNDDPRIGGEAIVRQGEWFLIPLDSDHEPDARLDPETWSDTFLGSHVPRDLGLDDADPFSGVEEARPLVQGHLKHERSEHHFAYVGENWHAAYESPRDDVAQLDDLESSSDARVGYD